MSRCDGSRLTLAEPPPTRASTTMIEETSAMIGDDKRPICEIFIGTPKLFLCFFTLFCLFLFLFLFFYFFYFFILFLIYDN